MPVTRAATTWMPVVAWAGVIFAISSIPSLSTQLGLWDDVIRKLAHVVEYAILALLLARALPPAPAWLVAVAYAATDEWHQTFVSGREGRPRDVAIDAAGALVGVLALRKFSR